MLVDRFVISNETLNSYTYYTQYLENYSGYLKRFNLPKTSILWILVRLNPFLPLALCRPLFNVSSISENTWSRKEVLIHQFPQQGRTDLNHP